MITTSQIADLFNLLGSSGLSTGDVRPVLLKYGIARIPHVTEMSWIEELSQDDKDNLYKELVALTKKNPLPRIPHLPMNEIKINTNPYPFKYTGQGINNPKDSIFNLNGNKIIYRPSPSLRLYHLITKTDNYYDIKEILTKSGIEIHNFTYIGPTGVKIIIKDPKIEKLFQIPENIDEIKINTSKLIKANVIDTLESTYFLQMDEFPEIYQSTIHNKGHYNGLYNTINDRLLISLHRNNVDEVKKALDQKNIPYKFNNHWSSPSIIVDGSKKYIKFKYPVSEIKINKPAFKLILRKSNVEVGNAFLEYPGLPTKYATFIGPEFGENLNAVSISDHPDEIELYIEALKKHNIPYVTKPSAVFPSQQIVKIRTPHKHFKIIDKISEIKINKPPSSPIEKYKHAINKAIEEYKEDEDHYYAEDVSLEDYILWTLYRVDDKWNKNLDTEEKRDKFDAGLFQYARNYSDSLQEIKINQPLHPIISRHKDDLKRWIEIYDDWDEDNNDLEGVGIGDYLGLMLRNNQIDWDDELLGKPNEEKRFLKSLKRFVELVRNKNINEIKINTPEHNPKIDAFKKLYLTFKIHNQIKPILDLAYRQEKFDDELVSTIHQIYKPFFNRYPEYMEDYWLEWLQGIKDEKLPKHSSGSFYTALFDLDAMEDELRSNIGYDKEEEFEDIRMKARMKATEDSLNEIKINKPLTLPIQINNREKGNKIQNQLYKKGYEWTSGESTKPLFVPIGSWITVDLKNNRLVWVRDIKDAEEYNLKGL